MTDAAESSSSVYRFSRVSERTRASSSTATYGLVRKSSAPASMPRTRSATAESAVSSTTGISRVAGSAFSRWHTSKPSRRGMFTSSSTISGRSTATAASAASPSPAVTAV